MKAVFGGQQNKGYHTYRAERVYDSRRTQQPYVFSGVDGGSDEQFYGCMTTLSFFVLVEHDGKLAEMYAVRWRKLPEPSHLHVSCSAAIHANRTCLSDYYRDSL